MPASASAPSRIIFSERDLSDRVVKSRLLGAPTYFCSMSIEPIKAAAVYFDGACPVCAREMSVYQRADGADALEFVDVARCGPAALGPSLSTDAALARLHVRLADGRLVSGAAAFAALWLSLPRWAWAGRIASLPVILPALELAYRGFLKLRRLWR
jgi:predicted DCC family thiol-disulfide oxidoreductase YuxK